MKFSMLLLIPMVSVLFVLQAIGRGQLNFRKAKFVVLHSFLFGATVYFCIIGGYGFADFAQSENQTTWSTLLPYPKYFLNGVSSLLAHQRGGHPAYFLGEFSHRGWWLYFPVALGLKVTVPALFLFLSGCLLWIWKRKGAERNIWLLLVTSYMACAMFSTINIGVRHLLPLFPLLIIASGEGVLFLVRLRRKIGLFLLVAGLSWLAVSSIRMHPHYLAYFNEFGGGPTHGWQYLSDSNTDWGQNSKAWAGYVKRNPAGQFLTAFHGPDHPWNYGATDQSVSELFAASLSNQKSEEPPDLPGGIYAVSTAFLVSQKIPQLAFLRQLPIIDHVGYTIRLYRVGPREKEMYIRWYEQWKPDPKAAF